MVEKRGVRGTEIRGVMEREEANVGNLEMRAKVRGEVWVKRLTAGKDIVREKELGIGSKSRSNNC